MQREGNIIELKCEDIGVDEKKKWNEIRGERDEGLLSCINLQR